jgi:hypothetical protein
MYSIARHQYPNDKPKSVHKLKNFCCCSFHSRHPEFPSLEDLDLDLILVCSYYGGSCRFYAIASVACYFVDFLSEDSTWHHRFC